jgi:hypothetical protein
MHARCFRDAGWCTNDRFGGRPTDRCVRPAAHRRHAARGAPAHRPRRLREFAGTSTGANLVAAIALGMRLGPDATVVTVMCDSGLKYLSTPLYA